MADDIYGPIQAGIDVTALALLLVASAAEPRRRVTFPPEETPGRGWLLSEEAWRDLSNTGIGLNLGLSGAYLLSQDGRSHPKEAILFGEAELYTAAIASAAKVVTGRKRPDGSDRGSFFSQHAALAFASSTYLSLSIGTDPALRASWEGPTMIGFSFLTAAMTGSSRVGAGKHYWSDVVGGALLGSVVSAVVFAAHRHGESNHRDGFQYPHSSPSADSDGRGFSVAGEF